MAAAAAGTIHKVGPAWMDVCVVRAEAYQGLYVGTALLLLFWRPQSLSWTMMSMSCRPKSRWFVLSFLVKKVFIEQINDNLAQYSLIVLTVGKKILLPSFHHHHHLF